jgi:carbon monoxide dehydrogenase subunit G
MHISSQQTLPASQENTWSALNDIEVLKACIPGCEALTETEPAQYEVLITAAVGPVKAKFKGKLSLTELNPPESYTIHFQGQGGAAGHGKGTAKVRLESTGHKQTVLHYTADASVGGKIAQIGQRLVDMAAQKMAGEFFENFNRQISIRYPGAPTAEGFTSHAPAPGIWMRFRLWLRSLLS